MEIATVNFRGLSLARLHPGGKRACLIPFALPQGVCEGE